MLNFFFPLVLIIAILGCLGFLAVMGYRSATASDFFEVKQVEIIGTTRVPKADIEKIVRNFGAKAGVWHIELDEIKADVEQLPYVKAAAVSRLLPDGIRVNVAERVPQAVVRRGSDDYWADDEGVILGPVLKSDQRPPFVLKGWDDGRTERSIKENQERVKLFRKLQEEWGTTDLSSRVREVDLGDTHDVKALIDEGGASIEIGIGKDNFGKRLKTALDAIAGKGDRVKSVNARGVYPVIQYSGS